MKEKHWLIAQVHDMSALHECPCTCQQSVHTLQYLHVQLIQLLCSFCLLLPLSSRLLHCFVESGQEMERGNHKVQRPVGETNFFEDLLAEALIEADMTQGELGVVPLVLVLH